MTPQVPGPGTRPQPLRRQRVLVLVGTRPEAIKLAPVVHELRARPHAFDVHLCASGQHRDLVPPALDAFDLRPDTTLAVMEQDQSLAALTARLTVALDEVLERQQPDWVLVQGDTLTATVGAMTAFFRRIPVGHVEAGLRTGRRATPFPEEVNRQVITRYATLHFAPTATSCRHLLDDQIAPSEIALVGNTVVDALFWIRERTRLGRSPLPPVVIERARGRRVVLVTCHRRETFGRGLDDICGAIVDVTRRVPNLLVVVPVHPNPNVAGPMAGRLGQCPDVVLTPPLPYRGFVALLDLADLVVTDSGGVQEEAPSLGKPVLVLREVTERTEGVEAGVARVIGTSRHAVTNAVVEMLTDPAARVAMVAKGNPYGDGFAARRIADRLEQAAADAALAPAPAPRDPADGFVPSPISS